MNNQKRYAKAYLLIAPIKIFLRIFWQIFLVTIVGSFLEGHRQILGKPSFNLFLALTMLGILILCFAYHLMCYLTQSYELTEEAFIFRKGIFQKKMVVIPYERIQTIKQNQWFYMVPFDVIRLMIETAANSGNEAEVDLPCVPKSLYAILEQYRHHADNHKPTNLKIAKPIFSLSSKALLLFSLSELSIFTPLILMLAILKVIPEKFQQELFGRFSHLFLVGSIILFISIYLFFAGIALAKTILKYANFKIYQENVNTLRIEYGLLEQKSQLLPIRKIQGIRLRQRFLSMAFGLVSVDLLLAASQEQLGEETTEQLAFPLLLPLVSVEKVQQYLATLVPSYAFQPPMQSIQSLRLWYFSRYKLLTIILPIAFAYIFSFNWLYTVLLIIFWIIFVVVYAYFQSKMQAYGMEADYLVFDRLHFFERVQTIIPRRNIQSFQMQTSPWLYLRQLAHCKISVKVGKGEFATTLYYLPLKSVEVLTKFYRGK